MLHKRIREARKFAGFTQQQLADKIGVKQQSYQKYEVDPEKGGTKMPEKLQEIADECKVNFHWLLTGEGIMAANASPIDKKIAESLPKLSSSQKDRILSYMMEFISSNKEIVMEVGGVFNPNKQNNSHAHA